MTANSQNQSPCASCLTAFKNRSIDPRLDSVLNCPECDCPFVRNRSRKFCCVLCRVRHSVQRAINQLQSVSFTIAEAATATGLSENAIRRIIRKNQIESFKLDRIRIRRSDAMRLAGDHGRRAK